MSTTVRFCPCHARDLLREQGHAASLRTRDTLQQNTHRAKLCRRRKSCPAGMHEEQGFSLLDCMRIVLSRKRLSSACSPPLILIWRGLTCERAVACWPFACNLQKYFCACVRTWLKFSQRKPRRATSAHNNQRGRGGAQDEGSPA